MTSGPESVREQWNDGWEWTVPVVVVVTFSFLFSVSVSVADTGASGRAKKMRTEEADRGEKASAGGEDEEKKATHLKAEKTGQDKPFCNETELITPRARGKEDTTRGTEERHGNGQLSLK